MTKVKELPRNKSKQEILEILANRGWSNLDWGSGPQSPSCAMVRVSRFQYKDFVCGMVLRGRPPGYNGPVGDYWESIVIERLNKSRTKRVSYHWVKSKQHPHSKICFSPGYYG